MQRGLDSSPLESSVPQSNWNDGAKSGVSNPYFAAGEAAQNADIEVRSEAKLGAELTLRERARRVLEVLNRDDDVEPLLALVEELAQ